MFETRKTYGPGQVRASLALCWPPLPTGQVFVQQRLKGGDYLSTGAFPQEALGPAGKGRTHANCSRVTSLFFDVDLVTLFSAAREAKGTILEERVEQRKAVLYAAPQGTVDAFKALLREQFVPLVEQVIGEQPTLLIDSGWGFHLHYALAEDVGHHKDGLRLLMRLLIAEVNRLAEQMGRDLSPQVQLPALFDATFDVGARLARRPGTTNTKAEGQPRPVSVLEAAPTVLSLAKVTELQTVLTRTASTDLKADAAADVLPPERSLGRQQTTVEVDFRSQRLPDGRSWQAVVDNMLPGDRMRVVCPFGGTSLGSGFFAKEDARRTRYFSGPTNTTYWNSYKPPLKEGKAELQMDAPKRKGAPALPVNSVSNLLTLLRNDDSFDLWYDDFRKKLMAGTSEVGDTFWLDVMTTMEQRYDWSWRPGQDTLWAAVTKVGKERARNPVAAWLSRLHWDGVPRLQDWLHIVCGVPDTALHRAYSLRWGIGLVARALRPGCKLDTSLVLAGPQGYGKSTVFREWVSVPGEPDLFADTKFDLGNKDAYLQLYACWLYEDAELTSSSASDAETRKAFLSSAIDRFRPPYGRAVETFERHTVIVGTTNEDIVLRDRTGDRRYWVVTVGADGSEAANLTWLREHRDQMVAEAVRRFSDGEAWWLTNEEANLQALANDAYRYHDWYSEIAKVAYLNNAGGPGARFTAAEFAAAIGESTSRQSKGLSMAAALARAGFVRSRIGGVTHYLRPDRNHGRIGNGLDVVANIVAGKNIVPTMLTVGEGVDINVEPAGAEPWRTEGT